MPQRSLSMLDWGQARAVNSRYFLHDFESVPGRHIKKIHAARLCGLTPIGCYALAAGRRAPLLVMERPSGGLALRRALANDRPSSIAAELSRTSRKTIRSSHVRSSVQSSHRRYCVDDTASE